MDFTPDYSQSPKNQEKLRKARLCNNDKSTLYLPRQVSWIGKQLFVNWGNIGHNRADELNDTTNLTTKRARLNA